MRTKALPFTIWLGCTSLALSVAAVQSAHARVEDPIPCFRDTQCPADQVCRSGTCTMPTDFDRCFPPPNPSCEYSDQVCEGEVCRSPLVTCSNPAGRCISEERGGDCECWDSHGSGWQNTQPEQDTSMEESTSTSGASSDEQLADRCRIELVKGCGSEIPDLPATCVDTSRTLCERVADLTKAYLALCERPIDRHQALWHCCNDLEQGGLTVEGATCMGDVKADSCENLISQLDTCAQLGQSDDDENETGTNGSTSSDGATTSTSSLSTSFETSTSSTDASSTVEMTSNPSAQQESGNCSAVADKSWPWPLAALLFMYRRRRPAGPGSAN